MIRHSQYMNQKHTFPGEILLTLLHTVFVLFLFLFLFLFFATV